MNRLVCGLVLMLAACGGPAPEASAPKTEALKPKPPDQSRRFVSEGRLSVELVDDHLLGKDYLPGGNVAEYEIDGKRHKRFLIVAKDPQAATFLAMDIKDRLTGAKYVPHFGGYFGLDGEEGWFIFPKDKNVAGIVGLPQAEADQVAREFAAGIY